MHEECLKVLDQIYRLLQVPFQGVIACGGTTTFSIENITEKDIPYGAMQSLHLYTGILIYVKREKTHV